jgi:hypothetical protein
MPKKTWVNWERLSLGARAGRRGRAERRCRPRGSECVRAKVRWMPWSERKG